MPVRACSALLRALYVLYLFTNLRDLSAFLLMPWFARQHCSANRARPGVGGHTYAKIAHVWPVSKPLLSKKLDGCILVGFGVCEKECVLLDELSLLEDDIFLCWV